MISTQVFQVNMPHIVYEVFDDEVVIVNLNSGHYYSTQHVGVMIWNEIIAGSSLAAIIRKLEHSYSTQASELEAEAKQFIEQLLAAGILSAQDRDVEDHELASELPSQKTEQAFQPPTLQQYTDMQDLLFLDPVHEVDETGWPNIAPDANDGKGQNP